MRPVAMSSEVRTFFRSSPLSSLHMRPNTRDPDTIPRFYDHQRMPETATTVPLVRVLWLIKGLGLGGAERLLVSMAQARDRVAFDYETAYLLPWKDALVPALEHEGVAVECLGGGKEWDLRWAWRLRRRLVRRPVDIVHVHSAYVASVLRPLIGAVPAHCRPRLVTTDHIPWSRLSRLTRVANQLTCGLDSARVAVSDEVRDSIPTRRRDVETVVHGVAVDRIAQERAFREDVRAELGISPNEVVVGTVANFRAQKAYPDLLLAARLVLDAGRATRFVAVGQGPLEEETRRRHAELCLGDRVLLLGGRQDPTRVMAGCDLFTLASHYEGYPVALMEALALGMPIVATAVGGIAQAVRPGVEGLLVQPARPDLLAAALLELVDDPSRRQRMSRAAQERAKEYDIGRACRRLEAVYQRLATRRASQAAP